MAINNRKQHFSIIRIIILALILSSSVGSALAKSGTATPDTTKMSRIQLMAWRASQQGKQGITQETLPEIPADVTRLTETEGMESEPCWSPDGKYIYYAFSGQGRSEIHRLELSTGEIVTVTDPANRCKSPSVNPSGTHLAFEITSSSMKSKIWIVRLEDGVQAKLTDASGVRREIHPCWNDNGYKLYFARSGNKDLRTTPWEIRRDGEQGRMMLDEPGQHTQPRLSRSGDDVAWIYQEGAQVSLRVINSKISAIYTDHPFDGLQIVSYDWLPGDSSMVISYLDPTLSPPRLILGIYDLQSDTHSPYLDLGKNESFPRVSPDGKSIVFSSSRYGQKDLFLKQLP